MLYSQESAQHVVILWCLRMLRVEADLQLHFPVDADQLRLVVLAGVIVEPDLHTSAVHIDVPPATDPGHEALECIAHDLEEPRFHQFRLRRTPRPQSGDFGQQSYRRDVAVRGDRGREQAS
jgi:hypothetical protein